MEISPVLDDLVVCSILVFGKLCSVFTWTFPVSCSESIAPSLNAETKIGVFEKVFDSGSSLMLSAVLVDSKKTWSVVISWSVTKGLVVMLSFSNSDGCASPSTLPIFFSIELEIEESLWVDSLFSWVKFSKSSKLKG